MCAHHDEALALTMDNVTHLMKAGAVACAVIGEVLDTLANISTHCTLSRDDLLRMADHVDPPNDDTQ